MRLSFTYPLSTWLGSLSSRSAQLLVDTKVSARLLNCGRLTVLGGAAMASILLDPSPQGANAIAILNSTQNYADGYNHFVAPPDSLDGNTYILSRGYAFKTGDQSLAITSFSAHVYDIFGTSFNSAISTARIELRSWQSDSPGNLLGSSIVSFNVFDPLNPLRSYPIANWSLSPNSTYWLGLNWQKPYNQGCLNDDCNNFPNYALGLFGWGVSVATSVADVAMAPGFTNLGFYQLVR